MDHVHFPDPDAQRVARFFTDLMVTLAEDDVDGPESVELVRTLWRGAPDQVPGSGLDVDTETLLQAFGGVATALAHQLVAERRAGGRADASTAEVWREVEAVLSEAGSAYDDGLSTGTVDSA
jgi:hypothetical protein